MTLLRLDGVFFCLDICILHVFLRGEHSHGYYTLKNTDFKSAEYKNTYFALGGKILGRLQRYFWGTALFLEENGLQ